MLLALQRNLLLTTPTKRPNHLCWTVNSCRGVLKWWGRRWYDVYRAAAQWVQLVDWWSEGSSPGCPGAALHVQVSLSKILNLKLLLMCSWHLVRVLRWAGNPSRVNPGLRPASELDLAPVSSDVRRRSRIRGRQQNVGVDWTLHFTQDLDRNSSCDVTVGTYYWHIISYTCYNTLLLLNEIYLYIHRMGNWRL